MTAARPLSGFRLVPGYLDRPAQEALLAALRTVFARAPLYTPRMPNSGKPLSVRMTNCGPLGWVTDEAGYRYQPQHPQTGQPWPPMPDIVIDAWTSLARYPDPLKAASSTITGRRRRWDCIRTVTSATSRRPSFRSRSATPACFGSAGLSAATRPHHAPRLR